MRKRAEKPPNGAEQIEDRVSLFRVDTQRRAKLMLEATTTSLRLSKAKPKPKKKGTNNIRANHLPLTITTRRQHKTRTCQIVDDEFERDLYRYRGIVIVCVTSFACRSYRCSIDFIQPLHLVWKLFRALATGNGSTNLFPDVHAFEHEMGRLSCLWGGSIVGHAFVAKTAPCAN